MLPRGVQNAGQVLRGVAGVGQPGARGGDERAGIGAGVGPDPADVEFRAEPAIELVQQLWEPTRDQGKLADQPIDLGRPAEHTGIPGAVVQLSDGLGRPLGQVQGRLVGHAALPVGRRSVSPYSTNGPSAAGPAGARRQTVRFPVNHAWTVLRSPPG